MTSLQLPFVRELITMRAVARIVIKNTTNMPTL